MAIDPAVLARQRGEEEPAPEPRTSFGTPIYGGTIPMRRRIRPGPKTQPGSDKRKKSLYLGGDIVEELEAEAVRTQRSESWLLQRAWKIARAEIAKLETVD